MVMRLTVRLCRPKIRRLGNGPISVWATKCVEHDTGWVSGIEGRWADALASAVIHQQEYATVVKTW